MTALNTLSERLNILWRNIASPNVALWAQVVRRRECCSLPDERAAGFAQNLATKYRERLATETLMVNELYLAVVYRPVATVATGLIARLLSRTQPDASRLELNRRARCLRETRADIAGIARSLRA